MTDFNRLQALSGKNPAQEKISALQGDLKNITEQYTIAIDAIKNGRQIDEGLWNNLSAAISTAGQIGSTAVKAAVEKAKKVSAAVKTIYQDKKAQVELKNLVNTMRKVLPLLGKAQDDAPTIFKLDKLVAKEFDIMYQVFVKTIGSLASRTALKEGIELNEAAMIDLMIEHEMIPESRVQLTEMLKNSYGDLNDVLRSAEFIKLNEKMTCISTHSQLKNGTLVFDSGFKGVSHLGEEVEGSRFLFKITSDGQVSAEVTGIPAQLGVPTVYKLGEAIKGDEIYKKALINVSQRYEKKAIRHAAELKLMKSQFSEWNAKVAQFNGGADASEAT